MARHGTMIIADRGTYNAMSKTVGGQPVALIAVQKVPKRDGKFNTYYIYHIRGTEEIIYNRNKAHPYWSAMGVSEATNKMYYDIFIRKPLTPNEKSWLDRNYYELL